MEHVRDFPHPVREHEHVTIPLSDGTTLAARIWLPEGAEDAPVPAILEYLPYRRRDRTRVRDDAHHPYMAGHGYAAIRVDMRGTGDAEGIIHDEYLLQEQLDGIEVIEWIASQPWCDGGVGMIGISWGGFNGLQIAAHAPEALKAVITMCSTDDRYADDIHYMGGTMLTDNWMWANSMYGRNFMPPDPATFGDGWRETWLKRLEEGRFWLEPWLEHQRRDAFWEHGSVCEDPAAIRCPVFAVGGWADGYSNAIPRLLETLDVPRLGLIGPWAHIYPDQGVPGPAMDFMSEALRWWDRWLKGEDTGIMDEPQLRAWIQESLPPDAGHAEREGRFVGEPSWPSPNLQPTTYALADGRLAVPGETVDDATWTVRSPVGTAMEAGDWCSYGSPGDLPTDQRAADGKSLVFDGPVLDEALEILGAPVLELALRSDQPQANLYVRLEDVRPDGGVTRVSYALFNLTHRDSHADPAPLEPGVTYPVRIQLNDVGYRFPAGHRVRLAIASDAWPLAWTSPSLATIEVDADGSAFTLPVRPPRDGDGAVTVLQPPRNAPPTPRTFVEPASLEREVTHDVLTGETTLEIRADGGTVVLHDTDAVVTLAHVLRYVHRGNDPTSARTEAHNVVRFQRGDWDASFETRTGMRADADAFYAYSKVDAYDAGERVFEREREERYGRDHV